MYISELGHATGHAHLGVVLCSIRRKGPSYIPEPNPKRLIYSFKRGPKILKLGHVTSATPTWGQFYVPYAGRVHSVYPTKFEMGSFIRSIVISGDPEIAKIGSHDPKPRPF